MSKVIIKLSKPDEDYTIQGKIVADILKLSELEKKHIVDVDEESITLDIDRGMSADPIKKLVRSKYQTSASVKTSLFSDGDTAGTGESVDTTAPPAEPITNNEMNNKTLQVDGEGIIGTSKNPSGKVNVDEIINDKSQYVDGEAPVVTYCDGESKIYLPASQATYSIGSITPAAAAELNKMIASQFSVFSSELAENSGAVELEREVQADYLTPNHDKSGVKEYVDRMNDYVRDADDARSWDARDPHRRPANGTRLESMADRSNSEGLTKDGNTLPHISLGDLPKMTTELPRTKDELVQRLLTNAFTAELGESLYSIAGNIGKRVVAAGATKMAVTAVGNKIGADPNATSQTAGRAAVAVGMNYNGISKSVSKVAKKLS